MFPAFDITTGRSCHEACNAEVAMAKLVGVGFKLCGALARALPMLQEAY